MNTARQVITDYLNAIEGCANSINAVSVNEWEELSGGLLTQEEQTCMNLGFNTVMAAIKLMRMSLNKAEAEKVAKQEHQGLDLRKQLILISRLQDIRIKAGEPEIVRNLATACLDVIEPSINGSTAV